MSIKNTNTRRGLALYKTNPYLLEASANTNSGNKRRTLQSPDGTKMMVTTESGEAVAPAGFWQLQEVDKTQFVKLYVNGVKAFKELTTAGTRVFELLYLQMQKSTGKDLIYLSFSALENEPISQATFTRGMRELIDKKFVAPTPQIGWYWVNPDFVWNGDRLAFVKEYRLKRDVKSDTDWRNALEAAGQERLQLE
jgi:hypothetical protein